MLWIINTYQNSLNSRLKCKRVDYNSDGYHHFLWKPGVAISLFHLTLFTMRKWKRENTKHTKAKTCFPVFAFTFPICKKI